MAWRVFRAPLDECHTGSPPECGVGVRRVEDRHRDVEWSPAQPFDGERVPGLGLGLDDFCDLVERMATNITTAPGRRPFSSCAAPSAALLPEALSFLLGPPSAGTQKGERPCVR